MARPGRPKADNPRDLVVTLRLTQAEYRALQARALRRGQSVGEYVRAVALASVVRDATGAGAQPTG